MRDAEALCSLFSKMGATRVAVTKVERVKTDPKFRTMCEANYCGRYGRCWTCPPHLGTYEELAARLSLYEDMVLIQTVGKIEDSFDYEGMVEISAKHSALMRAVAEEMSGEDALVLGAGGCSICESCAIITGEGCRFPEKALGSLEGYCIDVRALAEECGMKYINGQNTVTYFGAVLLR